MEIKVQPGKGEAHTLSVQAMPNELLLIHVPDPEKNRLLAVNDIKETRYAKVLAVGAPTGRHKVAPVKVGDTIVMMTATAGIAVGTLHFENKPVHRLEWRLIMATYEAEANE